MSLWSSSVDDDSLSLGAVAVDLVALDDSIVVSLWWSGPPQEGIAGTHFVQGQVEWCTSRCCIRLV